MRITVHLTPKASQNKVEGWTEDVKGEKVLRVKVTAVPESGNANDALIKLLSAFFKVPKSKISLIRGASSRIKYIEIQEER